MMPFLRTNAPWTLARAVAPEPTKNNEGVDLPITASNYREQGTGPGSVNWYLAWNSAWRANPTAMTIVAVVYLVITLLLIVWCAFVFGMIVRLGEGRQGRAIRIVLSHIANRLATPAFASAIMLAGYLCWGFWMWFSRCEPGTLMRSLNLANALILTVPNALFTVLWLVGSSCELSYQIRRPRDRQDEIRLPDLGAGGAAQPNPAPAAAFGGGSRAALRREIQIMLNQLARIMATLLAFRR